MASASGVAQEAAITAAAGEGPRPEGSGGGDEARVLADALRASLARHQEEAAEAFDSVHAAQKRLTAHLRMLLNALDSVAALSAPRPEAAAGVEQLRAAAGAARALQARLRGVAQRLDRVEAILSDMRSKGMIPQQQQQGAGSTQPP